MSASVLPAPARNFRLRRALHVRDFLIALSLANLCYIRIWKDLLAYTPAATYTIKTLPTRGVLLAAPVGVVLLALLVWIAVIVVRLRDGSTLGRAGRVFFLLMIAIPLDACRSILGDYYPIFRGELIRQIGTGATALLVVSLMAVAVFALIRWQATIPKLAAKLLLFLAPAVAVTFSHAILSIADHSSARFASTPLAPPAVARQAGRLLWIIFDEWDYRLSFVDRPATVQMPEIDRFRAQAIHATNAYPPARSTVESLPELLTGELFTEAKALDTDRFAVTIAGRRPQPWETLPNIFRVAKAAGYNTGLVGWYIPYCRVLSRDLDSCNWWAIPTQRTSIRPNFAEALIDEPRSLFETSLFSIFGQSLVVRKYIKLYNEILPATSRLVVDPNIGVSFVHFPIPHSPYPYDRFKGTLSRENSPIAGYLDNLALLDRSFGEIRKSLEAASLWDSTTVLISADHFFRSSKALDGKSDSRIPYMLKMAGQKQTFTFTPPFNTVLTKDLLTAILLGQVAAPEQAIGWLDQHHGDAPIKWLNARPVAEDSDQ
jgi:hypothetical protein